MTDNAEAMVLTSFAADALSLGAHWIYNTDKIKEKFGRTDRLIKPGEKSFHFGKDKGEFTHYGDQTLVLLSSVESGPGFDLKRFAEDWQGFFKTYPGYFDGATKATLSGFAEGKSPEEAGSRSSDLGGAARIAPLVFLYRGDADRLIRAARTQTLMTHNNPEVADAAEFFARVAVKCLDGAAPVAAMKAAQSQGFDKNPFRKWLREGLESAETDSVKAVVGFGQMCDVQGAFPSVIHFLARYQDDPKAALIENVMAGGDSAARGLILGMILGARHGLGPVPDAWVAGMVHYPKISALLKTLAEKMRA